jgi:hypothetical protein
VKQRRQHPSPALNRRAVIELVVAQIERDLAALIQATKAIHAEATDEQNKAENTTHVRWRRLTWLTVNRARWLNSSRRNRSLKY